MATSWVYGPLQGPQHIRLVHLQPGIRRKNIICDMVQVSLHNNPTYEALSYTWDLDDPPDDGQDDKSSYSIPISEESFHVTPNLYLALKRLRNPSQPRLLWIDAICINQRNILERNHQVHIMSKIYSQARRVIVWLGEEDQNDRLASDVIHKWQALSTTTDGNTIDTLSKLVNRGGGVL